MRISPKSARTLGIGVACAALGAGASAIAAAGAATPHHAQARSGRWHGARFGERRFGKDRFGGRHLGRGLGGAVHGQVVIPYNGAFATVTFDRGTVKSVSGQKLTLTEGTPSATYATPTLNIPSGAVIRNDGQNASLSQLTAGERVVVISGPKATRVLAHSAPKSSTSSSNTAATSAS